MKFRIYLAMLVLSLSIGGVSSAATDDPAVDGAVQQFNELFNKYAATGKTPDQKARGEFVDEIFAKQPVDQLSLDQIQSLIDKRMPFGASTKTRETLMAYLAKLAAQNDVTGARATMMKLGVVTVEKPVDELPTLKAALQHPAIGDAVAAGYGSELFESASAQEPDAILSIRPDLLKLADSIRSTSPVRLFVIGANFQIALARHLNSDQLHAFAPLRDKLAAAATEKLKTDLTQPETASLTRAVEQLNGAYARGELIGHPAPEIHFLWSNNPADEKKQIASLSDLKGKVVVLDFWATWCGPCVASFPRVKALQRYYRGYDVVVLGVTSPQGFVIIGGKRVDTGTDQAKEFSLIGDFIKEKDMTWPVGVSKEDVFNSDYGVTAIPDVVIIDPSGIVRYAGLHPAQPLEEKTAIIDHLLGEAKLTIPAQLLMSKPPTVN